MIELSEEKKAEIKNAVLNDFPEENENQLKSRIDFAIYAETVKEMRRRANFTGKLKEEISKYKN